MVATQRREVSAGRGRASKVLFLSTSYPTVERPWSAVFHRTACEALVRSGVDVRVVAPIPWVPGPLSTATSRWTTYHQTSRAYTMNGVRVERPRYLAPPGGNNWFWNHLAFRRAARSSLRREKVDFIHAQFGYPPGLAAAQIARNGGPPCVVVLHGSDVNVYPGLNRLNLTRFRTAIAGANEVLAVSGALAARAQELTGRLPLVRPIGLDLRNYDALPTREAARRQLGLRSDARYVLFVGYLCREKGVGLLLEALAAGVGKNVMGLFIGEGPMSEDVRRGHNAVSVGAKPNSEIPLWMRAANLFVLPSDSEGMPTVLVEAGAAGTPVIATRVGGIPELLSDGRGVMIPAGDLAALSIAIQAALVEEEATSDRAAALRRFVEREYDADQNAQRLVEIFERIRIPGTRELT